MKFVLFLEEKIAFVLFQITFLVILTFYLLYLSIPLSLLLLLDMLLTFVTFLFLCWEYHSKRKRRNQIIQLVDGLEEKYLISELLAPPRSLENEGYFYALKQACKAMNDKIGKMEQAQLEYQEYLESFVHEIKTPIAALSLSFDNKKDYEAQEEIFKINHFIDQMLYYARSDTTEKDYFVKAISLSDLVHGVILNYKEYFLRRKIELSIHDLEETVYTDQKWLNFILSQLIQNCLKYLDKDKKKVEIYSIKSPHDVTLIIKDNGIGISPSDLPRVFEKGFTGTNRQKEFSTGIGLYLSKKLSDRLGLSLSIHSTEKVGTEVAILFPASKAQPLYQKDKNNK